MILQYIAMLALIFLGAYLLHRQNARFEKAVGEFSSNLKTLTNHIKDAGRLQNNTREDEWEYGYCNKYLARRHKGNGNVQYFTACLDGNCWFDLSRGWWCNFKPDSDKS